MGSFALPPRGKTLLLGPNGAGKTTLFLRIVGLLDGPGIVRIGGQEVSLRRAQQVRRGIGRPEAGAGENLIPCSALPPEVDAGGLRHGAQPRGDGAPEAGPLRHVVAPSGPANPGS